MAIPAAWFSAKGAVAQWAVRRALVAAGLAPATFRVRSVGLTTLKLADISLGSSRWMTIEGVDATYSLRSLIAGRLVAAEVRGARWTVRVQEGTVDWGYSSKSNTGPATLDLPCDRLDVRDSFVDVVVDGDLQTFPIEAGATARPEGFECRVDTEALGRGVTLTAQARAGAGTVTLETEAQVRAPAPFTGDALAAPRGGTASVRATVFRSLDSGRTTVDAAILVDSLQEPAGDAGIVVGKATVKGQAEIDGRGELSELRASIDARDVRSGAVFAQAITLEAVKLDGPRARWKIAAAGDGWDLLNASGTIAMEARPASAAAAPRSAVFTVDLQSSPADSVAWRSADVTAHGGAVSGRVTVRVDGSGVNVLDGRLSVRDGSLHSGDLAISEVRTEIVMRAPEAVDIASLSAIVGDGGTVSASPFTLDLSAPRVETRLSVANLSLAEWLPVITGHHATAEGRVSGYTDISVDLTAGGPKVDRLNGVLRADPQHGFIQATDAEALGGFLDAQDPRFATDEVMGAVRERIVAALQDFAFNDLVVELSRDEDNTIARATLSGFGRHGADPQGLNLTLDVHVQDALVKLASRLASDSRINAAARKAIDRFFESTDTQEPPP